MVNWDIISHVAGSVVYMVNWDIISHGAAFRIRTCKFMWFSFCLGYQSP